jgi:hypothetical protein
MQTSRRSNPAREPPSVIDSDRSPAASKILEEKDAGC